MVINERQIIDYAHAWIFCPCSVTISSLPHLPHLHTLKCICLSILPSKGQRKSADELIIYSFTKTHMLILTYLP